MMNDIIEINGVTLEISDSGIIGRRIVSTFLDSPDIWALLSDEVKQKIIDKIRDDSEEEKQSIGVFHQIIDTLTHERKDP